MVGTHADVEVIRTEPGADEIGDFSLGRGGLLRSSSRVAVSCRTCGSFGLRNVRRGRGPLPAGRARSASVHDRQSTAGWGPQGTWTRETTIWPIDLAFSGPRLRAILHGAFDTGQGSHRMIVTDFSAP